MSDTVRTELPVIIERRDAIEWITLNRPERLNAITPAVANALADEFERLPSDSSVRVVILRGAGRAFSAGLDIKAALAGEAASPGIDRLSDLILNIHRCPQPVIALVHGPAYGAGFAFAVAADVRIAGQSLQMSDGFLNLGVSGCELGLSYFLPRHVGASMAAELMLAGTVLGADRALQSGLVSQVVPDSDLAAAGEQLAEAMLQVAPLALRKTKEILRQVIGESDLATVLDLEMATQRECAQAVDFNERLSAFVEKRRIGSSTESAANRAS